MRHHVKKKVKEKISFQVLKLFNYQIFYFNLTFLIIHDILIYLKKVMASILVKIIDSKSGKEILLRIKQNKNYFSRFSLINRS